MFDRRHMKTWLNKLIHYICSAYQRPPRDHFRFFQCFATLSRRHRSSVCWARDIAKFCMCAGLADMGQVIDSAACTRENFVIEFAFNVIYRQSRDRSCVHYSQPLQNSSLASNGTKMHRVQRAMPAVSQI